MKNSQIRYVFLLFLALPALFISCSKDDQIKLDFDLSVPETWQSVVYANEGFIYAANRTAVSASDSILEALYIYKEVLNSNFTLSSYYYTLKQQIIASPTYEELLYESDTLIDETNFKKMLSLEQIQYVNPTFRDTFLIDLQTTRYFFFENEIGYNMVFLSVYSIFYRNQPIFNDIMSTFHYKY